MPNTETPATTETAEVAPVIAPKPDGATPPAAVPAADRKMTAKEALDGLNAMEFKSQPEWVLDEPDPDVLGRMMQADDPLAGLYDDAPLPETQEQPPVETAQVDPAAEVAPVDQEPAAPELTEERVRTNINARRPDGTFVNNERTRAAMTLAHEQRIDVLDAYTRLFGEPKPASEKPAEAVPAKPEPTAAEIDAQIADVESQLEKAEDAFQPEEVIQKLNRQLRKLLPQRQDALLRDLRQQQAQQATQSTVEQQVNESVGRAEGAYPDASKPGTPLHGAIAAEVARLQQVPGAFNDPEWPELVAVKIANRLGIAAKIAPPATPAKAAAPAKPVVPGTPRKPATPVPSPAPGAVTSPAASPVSPHADIRARMQAAKASGNLRELQKIGAEIEALNKAA